MFRLESRYFVIFFGIFFIAAELITGLNYPIFRDEYYYIACANRPDIGYVDHPPFSIIILSIWKFIFGDSQLSIRILPAIMLLPLFYLAGLITKELGGNKTAQITGVLSFAFSMPVLAFHSYYSMNSFDMLFWAAMFFILLRIINTKDQKLWLLFGVVCGAGLMNKISVAFLMIGIFIALIITENRKMYKSKYFWYGFVISTIIFLPYIIWQFFHNFATVEFIRNASLYKIAGISQIDFIKEQILSTNPVNAAFWITGLLTLLFIKKYKKYRILGITYLAVLIFLIINKSKPYYLFPAYIILFAAGAVFLVSYFEQRKKLYTVWIGILLVIISTSFLSPMVMPVLSPESFIKYSSAIGIAPSTGENRDEGLLPQFYADRFGWYELAMKVSDAYVTLSDEEKKKCIVYAGNYGKAGALEYYSDVLPLPPVVSGHNNYWYWSEDIQDADIVIIIGGEYEDHIEEFNTVTETGVHTNKYAMPDENNLKIFIGRGLKVPMEIIRQQIKIFI